MPIPDGQITCAEVVVLGFTLAAGSNQTPCQNRYHYRRTTFVNLANKAQLSAAFIAGPMALLLAAANARYTPSALTIRWVNDAEDPPNQFAVPGVGAIATDSMVSEDACYMRLRTAKRGPRFNGSKHFGCVNEIDSVGDVLVGAGLVRWQAVQASLPVAIVDAGPNTWALAILSGPPLSQIKVNPTTVVVNDVLTVVLNRNLGNMRKRKCRRVI
jgi:hypothetical protein